MIVVIVVASLSILVDNAMRMLMYVSFMPTSLPGRNHSA
jgi:hypothetical protein